VKLPKNTANEKDLLRDSRHLRLRVESCVSTILDLNMRLGTGRIKPEIVAQFEKLRGFLTYVSDQSADEIDIEQIEEATNRLLAEVAISSERDIARLPRPGTTH
jgi:hypothetical protein